MPTKLDTRQSRNRTALSNVGSAADETLDNILDDIDSAVGSTSSDLSTHITDTTTHGTTGDVVGTSDTQTLINKTITGGSVQIPSRLDVKQDTETNLTTYAASASNGQLCFATDTKVMYQVKDGALEELGGGLGASDADTIHLILSDGLDSVSDIDLTGQNADFDGGGTITANSLTLSTASTDLLKSEDQVIEYSPGANGQNDYFGFTKSVPLAYRGRQIGFQFEYKNNSNVVDNDYRFCIKIKDGTLAGDTVYKNLSTQDNNNVGKTIRCDRWVPEDCTEVEFGWQNTSTTTTTQIIVDNILVTANPFVYQQINTYQTGRWRGKAGYGSAATKIPYFTNNDGETGSGIVNVNGADTINGAAITILRDCFISCSFSFGSTSGSLDAGISLNAADPTTSFTSIGAAKLSHDYARGTATVQMASASWSGYVNAGDIIRPHTGGNTSNETLWLWNFVASTEKEGVVHTGSAEVEKAEYNTWAGTGSAATKIPYYTNEIINTTGQLISVSNSAVNGFSITALQPCTVTMDLNYSDGVAYDTFGISLDSTQLTTAIGSITLSTRKAYGFISTANGADQVSVTIPLAAGQILRPHADPTPTGGTITSHHVLVTATPDARTIITPLTQTCYLKDVKTTGTSGGTFTSGAWRTRTLNTVEGDTSFVNLSSNQFTLGAGIYHIEIEAPAEGINSHKAKLYNITDTSDTMIGSTAQSDTSSVCTNSIIKGSLELTSLTTFEVQHRCAVSDTFGSAANMGVDEVYTQVKITKIK